MIDLGKVRPGSTIRIPFGSYTGSTGASSAASNFAVGDILIYKDGGTTERASTSGFTASTSFDSVTGINLVVIDLADNATAGFFSAGSEYFVIVSPITVDSQTVAFPIARFVIGLPGTIHETTIATLASQTSFTLTAGPAEDDALNGCVVYIHDVASAVQGGPAVVLDYTGSTKTVTLMAGTTFTAAVTDNVMFFPPVNVSGWNGLAAVELPLVPTTAGRKLDVSAGGEAGVDWANVGSPTATVGLSGTTVKTATDVETDTQDLQARTPAALTANGNTKADTLRVAGTVQTAGDLAALIGALADETDVATAVLDSADAIETGLTLRQALRLIAAAAAGKLSGAATATIVVRNAVADGKARITATVDADGNRSAVVTDVT